MTRAWHRCKRTSSSRGDAFVDVAALIGAFNVVDRIADATGIPLDPMMRVMSAEIRDQLGLAGFASSANTPSE